MFRHRFCAVPDTRESEVPMNAVPARPVSGDPGTATGRTATNRAVTVLALLASFAAVEHGVGEILQGSGAPESVMIESWPDSPAFSALNGEPALTILPDMVLAGVVTIAVALALAVYALGLAHRRHGGAGLLGLALLLLLVGGGFGPPLLLVILAAALLRPVASLRASGEVRQWLADRWRLLLAVTVAAYLGLFPGTVLLYSVAGVNSAGLVTVLMVTAFAGLLLTLVAARAHDGQRFLEGEASLRDESPRG